MWSGMNIQKMINGPYILTFFSTSVVIHILTKHAFLSGMNDFYILLDDFGAAQ